MIRKGKERKSEQRAGDDLPRGGRTTIRAMHISAGGLYGAAEALYDAGRLERAAAARSGRER